MSIIRVAVVLLAGLFSSVSIADKAASTTGAGTEPEFFDGMADEVLSSFGTRDTGRQ